MGCDGRMGDQTTSKGTCVRVPSAQTADAARFVRRVRDDGVRSLPADVRQTMDKLDVDCDCVSDVDACCAGNVLGKVGNDDG